MSDFPTPGKRRVIGGLSPDGEIGLAHAEHARVRTRVAKKEPGRRAVGSDEVALQADARDGDSDARETELEVRSVPDDDDSLVRGPRPLMLPQRESDADVREVRSRASVSALQHGSRTDSGPAGRSRGAERLSEERKYRFHANAKSVAREERRFDKTALHFDQHGRLMSHADYLAHCEKWDYAWRSIKRGDRILDVGCGTDAPLMRAINFVQSQAAKVMHREGGCYVGVDLNKLKVTNINWAQLIGEVDMTSDEGYETALRAIPGNPEQIDEGDGEGNPGDVRGYTLIVCLEVIEHMDVADGKSLLRNMHDLLSDGGRIILSTPVYDGKGQARNHIHEYYIDELQELIESVGLRVARRMGTFTSEPQLKAWLKENRPDWLALYMEAREFHSSGYMSGVLAPMVPDISRNNVWVLERSEEAT